MVRFLSLSFFLSCTRDWVICQELKHVDNKVGKTTNPTALGPNPDRNGWNAEVHRFPRAGVRVLPSLYHQVSGKFLTPLREHSESKSLFLPDMAP